ncbi:DMT family transporter [Paracoccus sp. p3-h83]|uniref:DMT family transporter n=1 Tax=Paracoccus sp. p3-h83 TaxID=3342805 RepID=UPI0035B8B355
MSGNALGAVLMVASMGLFALEDMWIKAVTAHLPVAQVLVIFGLGGTVICAAMALWRGEPLLPAAVRHPAMAWRAVAEIAGRLGYTLAIALSPLSSAGAILQATPLVVTLGAAAIFGERVGWRRWLAICLGFLGVLIVLRPWGAGFNMASVFAVIGMLGFAGRDLATRAAPRGLSHAVLGFYGFAMLVASGLMLAVFWGEAWLMPSTGDALRLAAATVVGVAAYLMLTAAMRMGEVGVIAPFRYTRLVFAIALGVLVFDERIDAAMIAGSVLIVGSGLFTLLRSRRVNRQVNQPVGPA